MTAATYADILLPELPASRQRLFTGPLTAVCGAAVAGLTSFYLLLSVVPGYVVAGDAADGAAGLVTGVLMLAGVLAECAAPRLLARFGNRAVFAAGLLLLGVPSLLLVPSGQLAAVVAVCAVRGVGFGLVVVVAGALVVSLVPADRRGEGLATYGVAACVPGVVALPLGLWLVDAVGYPAVFTAGAAAAVLGLAFLARLPGADTAETSAQPAATPAEPAHCLLPTARQPGQWRPAVVFAATTTAAGIVVAFLPLAAGLSATTAAAGLLVQAVAATAGRYWAGRYGDRRGHSRLVVPGLVAATAGMVLLLGLPSPVVAVLAMTVFGLGFGVTQSATFAIMVERAPAHSHGTVSALWNLAYDLGYGAGPLAFGVVLVGIGYPAALALTAVVMVTALVPARRDLTVRAA
jgi:MFS family permease